TVAALAAQRLEALTHRVDFVQDVPSPRDGGATVLGEVRPVRRTVQHPKPPPRLEFAYSRTGRRLGDPQPACCRPHASQLRDADRQTQALDDEIPGHRQSLCPGRCESGRTRVWSWPSLVRPIAVKALVCVPTSPSRGG